MRRVKTKPPVGPAPRSPAVSNTAEVAKLGGISPSTVRRWVAHGLLHPGRGPRGYLFSPSWADLTRVRGLLFAFEPPGDPGRARARARSLARSACGPRRGSHPRARSHPRPRRFPRCARSRHRAILAAVRRADGLGLRDSVRSRLARVAGCGAQSRRRRTGPGHRGWAPTWTRTQARTKTRVGRRPMHWRSFPTSPMRTSTSREFGNDWATAGARSDIFTRTAGSNGRRFFFLWPGNGHPIGCAFAAGCL